MDRNLAASIVSDYNLDKGALGRTGLNFLGAGTFSKEIIHYLDKYSKGEKCSFDDLKGKMPGKRLKQILANNGLLDDTGCLRVEIFQPVPSSNKPSNGRSS